jgi:GTPase SAR1 family protein
MTILITGSAGTGKTTIIKKLQILHPEWKYVATTNLAASLFGGKTIQSYFKFKGEQWFKYDTTPHNRKQTLVIDEASMLSSSQLSLLKAARPNYNLILVGDFNQLLPVAGLAITDLQIDKIYRMDFCYRTEDTGLRTFLDSILNNRTDNQFIKEHTTNAVLDTDTFITFTNKMVELNNGRFDLKAGELVRSRTWHFVDYTNKKGFTSRVRQRYGMETDETLRPFWFNNETWRYQKTLSYGVVELFNDRLGLVSIKKEIFDRYFVSCRSATFHSVQGQTIVNRIVVDLASLDLMDNDDTRARAFYVACSRVKTADKLWFIGEGVKKLAMSKIIDLAAVEPLSQDEIVECLNKEVLVMS